MNPYSFNVFSALDALKTFPRLELMSEQKKNNNTEIYNTYTSPAKTKYKLILINTKVYVLISWALV